MKSVTVEEAKSQQKEYKDEVESTAKQVIEELKNRYERNCWKNSLHAVMHERVENNHPWVLQTDKAILVLLYSNFPTAGIANGTGPIESDDLEYHGQRDYHGKSDFPFGEFAACAFGKDVLEKIGQFLEAEGINLNDEEFDSAAFLDVRYACPHCNNTWTEQYASACDSECRECGTENITALMYKKVDEEWTAEQDKEWESQKE